MKSAFNIKTGDWEIAWPGRVAKHDLVYLTPPNDPLHGIPLGNGEVGALCWCEENRIILVLNRSDLWDDLSPEGFTNWESTQEEYSTTLRHGCRIIIDFGMPVFDVFYLSDFTARLSLADARMSIHSQTPFGSVDFETFVDHESGILCCRLKHNLVENTPVDISLQRYGSRTFSHWYRIINRDPELGLYGTESGIDGETAYITHNLPSGTFAAGCRTVSDSTLKQNCTRVNSHVSKIELAEAAGIETEFMAAITGPMESDPVKELSQVLDNACSRGFDSILQGHSDKWKTFWLCSLMECGDDYLDNLWHLVMYYAECSQGGKYPGRFIGGLWFWNRDVQLWNFYFHWNQQVIYWPLNAAGHHHLCKPYLNYRFSALPKAKETARKLLDIDGAFVSDVADKDGNNSAAEVHNHTPVAQIAMDFWRHYQYTQDMDFLKKNALPYMLEAAKFFETIFKKEEDGKYHAQHGSGYEGWIMLRDSTTELGCAKALFPAVLKALEAANMEHDHSRLWRDMAENMADFIPATVGPEMINESEVQRGIFKGSSVYSNKVHSSGYGIEEKKPLCSIFAKDPEIVPQDALEALTRLEENIVARPALISWYMTDLTMYEGLFAGLVEMNPIFPSGVVGLSDKDSADFKLAVNTTVAYAMDAVGYDVLPVALARLGRRNELYDLLQMWPGRHQWFPNGWGQYGMDYMKADAALPFRVHPVNEASKAGIGEAFTFPAFPFRHMGLDSIPVPACAMNESLLQSYDGIIRVAPAVSESQNARFTLHAVGGFIVSSEIVDGKPQWIAIKSKVGGLCRLENPWETAYIGNKKCSESLIEFETDPDQIYIISPTSDTADNWETTSIDYEANKKPKTSTNGRARLGLPRMF